LLTHHFYGESDDPVPDKWGFYLDDEKILAWFAVNPDRIHPKLHPIPIGIAYQFYEYGNVDTFNECIAKYRSNRRTQLIYMNFSLDTNPFHRRPVYEFFKDKDFLTHASRKPLKDYLIDVACHKFVLSPRGNGLDCFRTWEALLMGTFPVVKTSTLDSLFEDLPVVIVNDWSEVTPDFLEKKYLELKQKEKKYNWKKLYMPYWEKIIKSFKN